MRRFISVGLWAGFAAYLLATTPAGAASSSGAAPTGTEKESAAPAAGDVAVPGREASPPVEPEPTFEINSFRFEGNTLFAGDRLAELIDDIAGNERTAADVEKARETVERFYHDQGYPAVLVNVPEQSAESGDIRLQVIESTIGATRITGNKYFTTAQILDKLPSLAPGSVLFVPGVQEDIGRVNRNPDLKVVPSMAPGKTPGTVDVDLKADDLSPFHGSVELSNRNSPNTKPLRLNGALHYDNLWHREHSLSAQYQTAPQDPSQVEVFSGSYALPAPWNWDDTILIYGVSSNSDTAFGEGFHSLGKGAIIGGRYIKRLPPYGSYNHTATLGVDYKNLSQETRQHGTADIKIPEYLPFTVAYNGSLPDTHGLTTFNATLAASFRGVLAATPEDFEAVRYQARGNYVIATLGVDRRQQLPAGMGFFLKLDGQIADQPLVFSEQYAAGGMENVRGFLESEFTGDSAFHATAELSAPDLAPKFGLGERFSIVPYLFFDCALLWTLQPLPGQIPLADLQGTGFGIRGFLFKDLEFELDWAFALEETAVEKRGDSRGYFKVKYQF
ncbi:ShlB/FhaC/HecB family hemolysin secretion/activation protein [Geomesophilobacter sediminis]|uniref:ShlB/FhaC/HecB family hemolysin secretion/activation protein n=1 Tax=Geomesophilobacter sediminis TaxID=2798584 RepID=A0A8J7J6B3_9BACT|nr:POTRA domain-containing protein [Geomesophilobacter sediminis]MBJ6724286.1 ShlB/FhaC/HecB family hemolysin secretion/activation protein [Geomesophilobacter sediminis]